MNFHIDLVNLIQSGQFDKRNLQPVMKIFRRKSRLRMQHQIEIILMALYTFFLVTPMYKATATIYVVSRNDSVLNFSSHFGTLAAGLGSFPFDYPTYLV